MKIEKAREYVTHRLSGELTEAGRIKIRWILTEAPQHHRTIYVQKAADAEVTAARIDNVQQLAAQMQPEGTLPLVLETGVPVRGWPAAWFAWFRRLR